MASLHACFRLSVLLAAASICHGAALTYNVDLSIGLGTLTGDIVTDGTLGVLGMSNIIDWNLTANDGIHSFDLNSASSVRAMDGDAVSATATQMFFNFSTTTDSYMFFESFAAAGGYACFVNAPNMGHCAPVGAAEETIVYGVGNEYTSTPLVGTQLIASQGSAVPEPSTLALLVAGLALLNRGRRWSRN
jgi:hypothetical protein